MKLRRGYWWIPLLAVIGILFALLHFLWGSKPKGEPLLAPSPPAATAVVTAQAPASPEHPAVSAKMDPGENPSPKQPSHTSLTEAEIQAIRSEMKISLAALYGAEKSFYAEFHRYTTDLEALGYFPEGRELHSKVGFLAPYYARDRKVEDENPLTLSTEELRRSSRNSSKNIFGFAQGAEGLNLSDAAKFCKMGCTANEEHFEIAVVANLDEDPEPEIWIINDKKEMVQVYNDREQ